MPLINNNNKNLYSSNNHKPGVNYFPRVYDQYLPGLSLQVGSTFDRFGSVVCMSGDGNTIAVGAPYYTDTADTGSLYRRKLIGMVRIYKFNDNKWTPKGSPLYGPSNNYMMGISMDLNYDGTKIVIGSAALEYGLCAYLTYTSSMEDPPSATTKAYSNSNQIWDKAKDVMEVADILQEGSSMIKDFKITGKLKVAGAGRAAAGFIMNKTFEEIKDLGGKNKEPDVLLTVQQNMYFDGINMSPEGNGYPDINIRGRGNVKVYKFENNEWNISSNISGEKDFLPENFGSSVKINHSGSNIIIGVPRYSSVERYRENNPLEDWHIALNITEIVANAVLTALGGPAGVIIAAAEMGIDAIMKEVESREKSNNKFIQYEKNLMNGSAGSSRETIESFSETSYYYRTNHIVWANRGHIEARSADGQYTDDATYIAFGDNKPNYKHQTIMDLYKLHYNYLATYNNYDYYMPTYETIHGAFRRKEELKAIDDRSSTLGSRYGESYIGAAIAYSSNGGRTVTFDRQDNSIRTSDGAIYYISNDYDTSVVTLAISGDGKKLAVGLPGHYVGIVLIFIWNETDKAWRKNSSNEYPENGGVLLRGDEDSGAVKYGNSVDLSYDGDILAVGAPFSIGLTSADTNAGKVKVYKWNLQTESWGLHGSIINGVKDNLLGTSIKLSGIGDTIVIGAPGVHRPSEHTTFVPIISRTFKRELGPNSITYTSIKHSPYDIDYTDINMPEDDNSLDPVDYEKPTITRTENSDQMYPMMKPHKVTVYSTKYTTTTIRRIEGSIIKGTGMETKSVEKKRRLVTYYDEGPHGFVKVFRYINGDWNQNCFDSTESTDIRMEPLIPELPISATELRGRKIVNFYLGTVYVDPGIIPPPGYILAETIKDYDEKVAGYYNIAYIIKNKRGHITRFDREVNVIRRPTINNSTPFIILKGDTFDEKANYGLWMEGGVDAIISLTHNVNTAISGNYSIVYNVAITINPYNSEFITLTRNIRVIPKRIITINYGTQFIRQFNNYKELGATIKDTDNNILNPDIISTIIPFSRVVETYSVTYLTPVIGTYYVTYSAEYATSVTRKVIVTSPYVKSLQSLLKEASL